MKHGNTLYEDRLVKITDDSILFKWYFFPFGRKTLPLSEIESVTSERPRLFNGQWRIHGGNIQTWFPLDWKRPLRDRIFRITMQKHWNRIGFTVEHSEEVERIFQAKQLLVSK